MLAYDKVLDSLRFGVVVHDATVQVRSCDHDDLVQIRGVDDRRGAAGRWDWTRGLELAPDARGHIK